MTHKKNKENIRDKAVALKYLPQEERAPKVVAKGEGYIAQEIKRIAEKYGIPIKEDNDLVELLAKVDLDMEIPQELYAAVAEILAWVYRANSEIKKTLAQ
jgi:flagellar biosynthesis protein